MSPERVGWTITTAVPVVQQVALIARKHGFAVALYGGVLNNGRSDHDLDLYFITAEQNTTTTHMQQCLGEIATLLGATCHAQGNSCARVQFNDGRRIDAQFIDYTPLHDPSTEAAL